MPTCNRPRREVQEKAAALPDVASASAQAMVTRGLGPQEIMMGLQMATGVMTHGDGGGGGADGIIGGAEEAGRRDAGLEQGDGAGRFEEGARGPVNGARRTEVGGSVGGRRDSRRRKKSAGMSAGTA